jgi:hypothetical protein
MIALELNKHVWSKLQEDAFFNAKYDKYRLLYGQNFIPFFPVADNYAGDISWDSEPYFLYDSISLQPNRQVFGERREQVLYTLVGKVPEILQVRDRIVRLFSFWLDSDFVSSVYRINNADVWQLSQARGRDNLRQTYSIDLTFEIHYLLCDENI